MKLKRALFISVAAIMVLMAFSAPVLAAHDAGYSVTAIGGTRYLRRGDANLDGAVNMDDAWFISNYQGGFVSLIGTENRHFNIVDVNGDGIIDDGDFLCIYNENIPDVLYGNKIGDANLDGVVNTGDAATISRYAAGIIDIGEFAYAVSDVNNDGLVNQTDAELVLQYSVS